MSAASHDAGYLPLHRCEALTDGIFAVAMTLLVIELKLPDHGLVHSADELAAALLAPTPMPLARYRGACLRISGVILISVVAVALGMVMPVPSMGNMAFMLMAV